MKKYILAGASALAIALGAATAMGVQPRGLGFIVPQVNGRSNVANPVVGELIFDQADGNFYGRDASNNWLDMTASSNTGNPVGAIIAYAGTTSPSGYLLCDGSAVSRTVYAALFAAIGTTFGSGDGSTTFNLPDLRGRFLRGVDGSTGRDPDASTRTAMNPGGNVGDNVGSVEVDAFKSHTHQIRQLQNEILSASGSSGTYTFGDTFNNSLRITGYNTNLLLNEGGSETRPINANVNYLIKI